MFYLHVSMKSRIWGKRSYSSLTRLSELQGISLIFRPQWNAMFTRALQNQTMWNKFLESEIAQLIGLSALESRRGSGEGG